MRTRFARLLSLLMAACLFTLPAPSQAGETMGVAKTELRPGWRMADGTHMAALHIVLEPGWKTYWRAPGDVGIPPRFDWTGSRNVATVATQWPTPEVFFEQGMRSVGYQREVVLPLRLTSSIDGKAMHLSGTMELGVCKDICIPASLSFDAVLPPGKTRPDPRIAAALTDMPYTAREAGVGTVTCRLEPGADGALALHTQIEMPRAGGQEFVVIETGNPHVWVAEPESRRDGDTLHASTRLLHVEGRSFALDRSHLRITVIGASHAVDIRGCDG